MTQGLSVVAPPPVVERDVDKYMVQAEVAFDAGFFAECGAQLREAIRRAMFCIFEYKQLKMPRRKVKRTTGELVILLKKAEVFEEEETADMLKRLEVANRAAYCSFVTRADLRHAVRSTRWELDYFRDKMPGAF